MTRSPDPIATPPPPKKGPTDVLLIMTLLAIVIAPVMNMRCNSAYCESDDAMMASAVKPLKSW